MTLLGWIDRHHWLWLLLAAPLMLFPNPKRTPILLVVPTLWLLRWYVARCSPPALSGAEEPHLALRTSHFILVTPLNGSILLIAIMLLVSTWATYDIAFSLPKVSGMVLGLGVFFAVAREAARSRGWWLSLTFYLALGVGVAVLGLLGTNWFASKISALNPVTSELPILITGLQGAETGFHPNEIAGALTWVLPVFLTLSVSLLRRTAPRTWRPLQGNGRLKTWGVRAVLWLTSLFVLAVFILTQSRSGYLAIAITSLILLFIALSARWRWALLGGIVIAGLILGFTLSNEDLLAARDWLTGSGLTTEGALSLNTLEGRVEIWSRAIYGLQDFPFTGMGMNTFREVVHVLYPLFLVAPDVDFGHAHNEFLQAGLDLGIPGLIAFLALYIGAFWMLTSIWMNAPRSTLHTRRLTSFSPVTLKTIVLGLGGGLSAHLLYGLTDAVALGAKPGVLFWMLLGLLAGLYNQVCPPVLAGD